MNMASILTTYRARQAVLLVGVVLLPSTCAIAQTAATDDVDKAIEPANNQKVLTRAQLLKSTEEWKKSHHMRVSSSEMPVTARELLAAATVDDMPVLLEVKAAVLARLSDECLYEVQSINAAVKRLGRSRYRKEVGITAKAEAR
jgi:hypothetical protein